LVSGSDFTSGLAQAQTRPLKNSDKIYAKERPTHKKRDVLRVTSQIESFGTNFREDKRGLEKKVSLPLLVITFPARWKAITEFAVGLRKTVGLSRILTEIFEK